MRYLLQHLEAIIEGLFFEGKIPIFLTLDHVIILVVLKGKLLIILAVQHILVVAAARFPTARRRSGRESAFRFMVWNLILPL